MEGKICVYLLWPFEKKLTFTIVAWSIVRNSTVASSGFQTGELYFDLGIDEGSRRMLHSALHHLSQL